MIHLTNANRQFAETGIEGVTSAAIWGNDKGDGSDFLAFNAGAVFPLHDHEGPEEVVVLSGKIRFGDLVLTAGDYLRIGNGETHDVEAIEDTVFFLAHIGGPIVQD